MPHPDLELALEIMGLAELPSRPRHAVQRRAVAVEPGDQPGSPIELMSYPILIFRIFYVNSERITKSTTLS